MKRIVAVIVLFALEAAGLFAASVPLVIYAEGRAEVQDAKGKRRPAAIGDFVLIDETIYTGKGGRIRLQSNDGVFDVFENTVLKLMQTQKNGRKQNAYICVLGRVGMKVNRLATGDPGPRLGTTTMAAGVKGTALDVYEGEDGSSLVLVSEGAVDVESQGATVALGANEGVEVAPGRAPGAKFVVRRPIDYREWNEVKFEQFLKNPADGVKAVQKELQAYVEEIKSLYAEYETWKEKIKSAEDEMKTIEKENGREEAKKYYIERIMPLNVDATSVYLNIRFDSLSALSLRRFIIGRLYMFMRIQYLGKYDDKNYKDFMSAYGATLDLFTEGIGRYIVEADI